MPLPMVNNVYNFILSCRSQSFNFWLKTIDYSPLFGSQKKANPLTNIYEERVSKGLVYGVTTFTILVWGHAQAYLLVHLPRLLAGRLHSEGCAEDVAQLGSEAVPPARHLLLLVVVVGGGEQRAKDELWDVHLLRAVHLYGNTTAIVPDADQVLLTGAVHGETDRGGGGGGGGGNMLWHSG